MPNVVTPITARVFNEIWFRKAPRADHGRIVPLVPFFYPLDAVGDWNRLYGRRGFVQYQFVVPFGEESTVRDAIERLAASGSASFLAVLKRFGPGRGMLSFPIEGWTLALDIPARRGPARSAPGRPRPAGRGRGRTRLPREGRPSGSGCAGCDVPGAGARRRDPLGARSVERVPVRPRAPAGDRRGRPEGGRRVSDGLGRYRTILVLGGGSDIGLATAKRLVGSGTKHVILAARRPEALMSSADELRARGAEDVELLDFDALDLASHASFVGGSVRTRSRHRSGPPHVRGAAGRGGGGEGCRASRSRRRARTTSAPCPSCCRSRAGMLAQGHGTIVVLSSVAAERGRRSNFVYGSSKAGLDTFCQGLADRLHASGVRLLVVRPGFVRLLDDARDGSGAARHDARRGRRRPSTTVFRARRRSSGCRRSSDG